MVSTLELLGSRMMSEGRRGVRGYIAGSKACYYIVFLLLLPFFSPLYYVLLLLPDNSNSIPRGLCYDLPMRREGLVVYPILAHLCHEQHIKESLDTPLLHINVREMSLRDYQKKSHFLRLKPKNRAFGCVEHMKPTK
ncbi:hypothetical protein M431DRAFT_395105 [Trichoderma harzianum CBS 226.95]|uniref:Uncharacterized protein n=1 Tax=Trichoderma harzianum CBS 226.95 TaxID=983964 RepID=A0A2T4AJD2_TRIHA|nr:hypothetical protein M431DRAFT_395105 [Trichoderma harzianum CBS 226.95]PTB57142.1 hypothetical protein M431DRAFT_395105 [Trichoderma harzianum CBS 226.95]